MSNDPPPARPAAPHDSAEVAAGHVRCSGDAPPAARPIPPRAPATAALKANTAEGNLLIAHRDHGTEEGWHRPPFTSADLAAVATAMPTVFYSVNCLTGRFNLAPPKQCFAEVNLDRPALAPSIIAATRVSGTFRNNSLMKGLFDASWPGVLPAFPAGGVHSYAVRANRLGDVLNYGKVYLLTAHAGDPAGVRDHLEIYHVLGDPTLELWKSAPKKNGLHVAVRPVGASVQVTVRMDACPAGTVLTAWGARDQMIQRLTPTSPTVSFTLPRALPGPLPVPFPHGQFTLCFKAPGYQYAEQAVRLP